MPGGRERRVGTGGKSSWIDLPQRQRQGGRKRIICRGGDSGGEGDHDGKNKEGEHTGHEKRGMNGPAKGVPAEKEDRRASDSI